VRDPNTIADVDLRVERPTAVCDGNPNIAFLGAPESSIACDTGLGLGFRALRVDMPAIDRLYLHRRPCAALPCTQYELDVVDVIGWLGERAMTVTIVEGQLTFPLDGAVAAWPAASTSVPPPIDRPLIKGAPREIARREPYPYCGRQQPTDSGQPDQRRVEINRCFIDGVLDGRPVEMVFIPEVIREPILFRFSGRGFVDAWSARNGSWATCITLGSSVYWGQAC
jgi:hypothetical protein